MYELVRLSRPNAFEIVQRGTLVGFAWLDGDCWSANTQKLSEPAFSGVTAKDVADQLVRAIAGS